MREPERRIQIAMDWKRKREEAEACKKELLNVLKTMHLPTFDYASEILLDDNGEDNTVDDDLEDVVKDAYNNFSSNFNMAMGHLKRLYGTGNFAFQLDKGLRFLRTSFRCLLKWCIHHYKNLDAGTRTMMNPRLISLLAKVGHLFSYLAAALTESDVELDEIDRHCRYASDLINGMLEDVGAAHLDVITRYSSPSIYFAMSHVSVLEFLDQVLENFQDLGILRNYYNVGEDDKIMLQHFRFPRGLLLFHCKQGTTDMDMDTDRDSQRQVEKDWLVHVEAVGDMAAYVFYFRWIKGRDFGAYSRLRDRISLKPLMKHPQTELILRIRKASLFLLKNPLSDELVVGLLDFLLHYLSEVRHDRFDEMVHCGERLRTLRHFLADPTPKYFMEGEIFRGLISEADVLARRIGYEILSFKGEWRDGDDSFWSSIRNSLHEIYLVEKSFQEFEKEPLPHNVLIAFLDFLHHNLIGTSKLEGKDGLEILARELSFLRRHFLLIQPEYSTDLDDSRDLRLEIGAAARKIGSMVFPHFQDVDNSSIPEAIMKLSLSHVLKYVRLMKVSAIKLVQDNLRDHELILLEFTNSLQHNLIQVLKHMEAAALKDQLETMFQTWGFMRHILIRQYQEKLRGFALQIEAVLRRTASVIYSYYFNDETKGNLDTTLSHELSDLLIQVMHIEASVIPSEETPLSDELLMGFVALLHHNVNHLRKDELGAFNEELMFLRHFLADYQPNDYPPYGKQDKLFDVKLSIEVVVRKIASAIHLIFEKEMNRDCEMELDFWLSNLHEEIQLTKARLAEVIFVMDLHQIRGKSPETDQLGFLNFLLESLRELIISRKFDSIVDLSRDQIQRIYEDRVFGIPSPLYHGKSHWKC